MAARAQLQAWYRHRRERWLASRDRRESGTASGITLTPVSYTHLTLPTIYSV